MCLLRIILLLSLAMLTGGCSLSDSSSQDHNTRPFEHALGVIEIPEDPQRVVTLNGASLDAMIALDLKPVGTVLNEPVEDQFLFLRSGLAGVTRVGTIAEPSLEMILTLQPDLMLGETIVSRDTYSPLSQVAPTILARTESLGGWRNMFRFYADALGKVEEAESYITHYEKKTESFREQLNNPDLVVSIVRLYTDSISIYHKGSFAGAVLEDVGLKRPESQQGEIVQQSISKELLPQADGDVIFLWSDSEQPQELIKNLQSDPIWNRLEAVKRGQVYVVPGYWIGFGPLAANAILNDLFKYLLEPQADQNES